MGNYDHGYSGRGDGGAVPLGKIALGIAVVAVGVYVGNIMFAKFLAYQAEQALAQAAMKAKAEVEQARMQQLQVEQERTRQKQLELDFKREQAERLANQQAAERYKEEAWKRFYKKPARCEDVSRQDVLVECGNLYIQERNRFEAMWASNRGAM